MIPAGIVAALVLLLVALTVLVVLLTTYNAVVAMQRRVDKAWANVDVALEQRHDELPNLVEAVRGEMAYEQGVLEAVTRARAGYARGEPVSRQAVDAERTSVAVRSLLATIERYPDLRSQENVLSLQREIERLETVIATRREFYNDSVFLYNATIRQIPAVLLAGLLGWMPREFFRAPDDLRTAEPPAVEVAPGARP